MEALAGGLQGACQPAGEDLLQDSRQSAGGGMAHFGVHGQK
jgi:hypothetical protein